MPSTFSGFQNSAAPKVDPYSMSTPYGAQPSPVDAYKVQPPASQFNPGNYANMAPGQRPPAFQQSMQTQFGQMDPGEYYKQRDGFVSAALNQANQNAAYAGVSGAPQTYQAPAWNPSNLWPQQAGQQPFQQPLQPPPFLQDAMLPPPVNPLLGLTPQQAAQETRMQAESERRQEEANRREYARRQQAAPPAIRPGQFADPMTGRVFNRSRVPQGGWMSPRQLAAWEASQRATSPYYWDETTRRMVSNPWMRQ